MHAIEKLKANIYVLSTFKKLAVVSGIKHSNNFTFLSCFQG